jgi:hypothetical protein
LQVDDGGKDHNSGNEVHDVWQPLAPEGLLQRAAFVVPGQKEMEERNKSALELGATASVDGGGGEGLPDNRLTNVGGYEEGNTRAETVSLLEEFIEENDDERGDDKLEDEQEADAST